MHPSVADTATATFVTKAGYTVGSMGTVASGVLYWGHTAEEWTVLAAIGSLAVAVLGFLVGTVTNIYFKQQHLDLARSLHRPDEDE